MPNTNTPAFPTLSTLPIGSADWLAERLWDCYWNDPESIGVEFRVVQREYGVEIIDVGTGELLRYADYGYLRALFH